jgi:hypothetical protein
MSNSLYNSLFLNNFTKLPKENQIAFFTICVGTHALYSFITQKIENIQIKQLYKYNKNGNTNFMLIDNNDKHYNVNNSFWYCKWNAIEDWNKLKIGDKINIKYYGYRMQVFGIFPIIVTINIPKSPKPKTETTSHSKNKLFFFENENKIIY